ncbi:dephospho-CoA kinase [Enterobacteriaceae bacterium LUAb1]
MVYTVALTGGIGSGKSCIASAFAQLGVTVIDADIIARQVVEPGQPALQKIIDYFGKQIITPEGRLDRAALRQRIFTHDAEKRWLNALLHPLIHAETCRQISACQDLWCMWVVPLLVEKQLYSLAQRILVVDVPLDIQLTRTMKRDGISRKQAEQIIAAQASRSERLAVADDIIDNSSTLDNILPQVVELAKNYRLQAVTRQDNKHDNHRSF